MITRLLKYGLLFGLVFGLVWLGVVIWWQESNRAVTAEDVIVWMGVLPLLLIGGFFVVRWGYRVATRPAAPPSTEAEVGASTGGTATVFDDGERKFKLAVVATGFAGMAGDSPDAAAAALKSRKSEPVLDEKVRDADGFPVKTARHPSLDPSAVEPWLDRFSAHPDGGLIEPRDHERLLRSLALLESALMPVLDALAPLFPQPADPHAPPSMPPRRLAVVVIDAEGPDAITTSAVGRFVDDRISSAGWGPVSLEITHRPVTALQETTLALDRFVIAANRDGLKDVMLLVGNDSALDEETLADWQRRECFQSGSRPNGLIPGEAAAVIALIGPTAVPAELPVIALLHRIATGLRDKSADARGRITGDLLCTLSTQALDAAEVKPETCSVVITDAATASSRHLEAASMMTTLLPELNAVDDRLNLGEAFGELGAARLPALLVLAASHCIAEQKPLLVNGVVDEHLRFALMMTPADTPSASG